MAERLLMKGNEVIAEAAIRAGCRHYFGYPITPQTEIAHYMAKRMPEIGGKFIQAESEVAAINMVYGAAGARRKPEQGAGGAAPRKPRRTARSQGAGRGSRACAARSKIIRESC
jgi:hypothetical protein